MIRLYDAHGTTDVIDFVEDFPDLETVSSFIGQVYHGEPDATIVLNWKKDDLDDCGTQDKY